MPSEARQTRGRARGGCVLMAGRDLLDPALAERVSRMARFRNLLVHTCRKADCRRVHDLGDLRAFADVVDGLAQRA